MIRSLLMLLALTSVLSIAVQATPAGGQKPAATVTPATSATPAAVVNINTATAPEFEALPGIGPKTAARIVEYRQKNGPFKKIEELMNVRGLGEKNFLKLKAQLTVGTAKTGDR